MTHIDICFSNKIMDCLCRMIGLNFVKFRADPFVFSNSVFERVGIYTSDRVYLLKNTLHTIDYFGSQEDICGLEWYEVTETEIHSGLENTTQVDTLINRTIKEIHVVQEEQTLVRDLASIYELCFTRGILFIMDDGYEISFEMTNPFVETIAIRRGRNLIDGYTPIRSDDNDWPDGCKLKTNRTIDVLR